MTLDSAATSTHAIPQIPPFQTTFAVPLHCQSCVQSVSDALHNIKGIQSVSHSLVNQTFCIYGTAPPSQLVAAIQSTGRDAILRGSGASNSAAVCILEVAQLPHSSLSSPVRGLARFVQVAPMIVLIDLTVRGLRPGKYVASIHQTGDISRGVASLGGRWDSSPPASFPTSSTPSSDSDLSSASQRPSKGLLGDVEVNESGSGSTLLTKDIQIWEIIGRGMTVSPMTKGWRMGHLGTTDEGTVIGIVARSAGVWDNEKTVCSCSGKTVWEERNEQVQKGML